MSEPRKDLDSLIESVVDGREVDWEAARSDAADRERRLLEQLRVLAEIGTFAKGPIAESRSALSAGERWGSFELLERLGQGASGEVWRARDIHLDREVALKLLTDPSGTVQHSSGDDLLHEGRLLSRVRHPNVVTVYGADRHEGRIGLWMECINGQTLAGQLQATGPLGAREAATIGADICRALAAIHAAGLVHRDVKLQNVMREAGGRTVLMDLGIGVDLGKSRAGEPMAGTPLYLAPEIFAGEGASAASDLYSLGVLLFHLVSRTYPVRGETVDEVARAHARGSRLFLRDIRPDLPASFANVVERALERDPMRRFGSAPEMERGLLAGATGIRRVPARRIRIIAAALTVSIAAAAALFRFSANEGLTPAAGQMTWELIVPQLEGPGAITADDSTMVFNDPSGSVRVLTISNGSVRQLVPATGSARAGDTVLLDETETEVLYTWHDDACECAELRRVPLAGGSPRRVALQHQFTYLEPIDLASDGVHLLVMAATAEEPVVRLAIIALDSGIDTELMAAPRNLFASLSPDARFVAYSLPAGNGQINADVSLLDWHTGERWPLVTGPADDAAPLWRPDSRGVVFLSDRAGGSGLWEVIVEDGRPQGGPVLLQRDMGRFIPLRLSRGGLFSYWRSPILDIELATFDPEKGRAIGLPVPAPVRVVGANTAPSWSPDGRAFVYSSERKAIGAARSTLVIHSRADTNERELSVPVNGFLEPSWSSDGNTLLIRGPGALDDIRGTHLIDVKTGLLTASFPFPVFSHLEWARDGGSFFYLGPDGVERMYLSVKRPVPITVANRWKPSTIVLSPDSEHIAANAAGPDGSAVIVMRADGREPRIVSRASAGESLPVIWDWTPDGRFLMGVRPASAEDPSNGELVTVRLEDGEIASAGLVRRGLSWVRVSPDGREILYRTGLNQRTLWLMDGLLSEPVR